MWGEYGRTSRGRRRKEQFLNINTNSTENSGISLTDMIKNGDKEDINNRTEISFKIHPNLRGFCVI